MEFVKGEFGENYTLRILNDDGTDADISTYTGVRLIIEDFDGTELLNITANLTVFKNVDTENLSVLEAELKNLELGNNPSQQERGRIQSLRDKIARIKNSGNVGGNQNSLLMATPYNGGWYTTTTYLWNGTTWATTGSLNTGRTTGATGAS